MDVIARIDQARREWDVLVHPFYQRWSAGTLSEGELGIYAGQYRHAVAALAQASGKLARRAAGEPGLAQHAAALQRHAAEESAHISLWEEFAGEAMRRRGEQPPATAPGGADAFEPTRACVRSWTEAQDALELLAVLYAIEASQPQIAKTKLEGLVQRYAYSEEGPATEYFRLHATLDVEHAAAAELLIRELMSDGEAQASAREERMVRRAKAALRGNWELLDGVEAHCRR